MKQVKSRLWGSSLEYLYDLQVLRHVKSSKRNVGMSIGLKLITCLLNTYVRKVPSILSLRVSVSRI